MHLSFRTLGQGPPLLILHGVFGSSDNWLTVSKLFAEQYQVFLIDQRNHGRSPHTNEFNYRLLVEDLKDFTSQQNVSKFRLIGHSMGGKVAMKFATKYPEMLEKLVVVDIAPRYYKPHHEDVLAAFHSVDLEKMTNRNEADQAMAKHIPELDTRQFLLKNLYRDENGKFAWRINLPVLTREIGQVGEELDPSVKIDVPTLFVKGGNSRYISDQDQVQISDQFSDSRIITINNAGHWVQAEQPATFAEAVNHFLR